ncbi:hypothetical protein Pmani_036535 [Petrolisthes manimaculis]|uniref:Uncharacterized protein n=1 Tax=Petrolisthes manimaculis TaxID=1843537 RepID=A0AAE1NIJ3_9EUCA|nr:hypothetical protein Pmani_036535 [Petrolisthes manimaculis]
MGVIRGLGWLEGGREGGAGSPSREQRRPIPRSKVVKGRDRAPMRPLAVLVHFSLWNHLLQVLVRGPYLYIFLRVPSTTTPLSLRSSSSSFPSQFPLHHFLLLVSILRTLKCVVEF